MGSANPVRLEFFDNEIESIKEFDIETQLSTKVLDNVQVTPFSEQFSDNNSSLFDYISPDWTFFIDRPQIDAAYQKLQSDITEYFERKNETYHKLMFDFDDIKYCGYNNLDKFEVNNENLAALQSELDFARLVYQARKTEADTAGKLKNYAR